MIEQEYTKETLKTERVETLMLMSVLAGTPLRNHALQELRRRRIAVTQERLFDAFMLLS
jgi:hypothetical protein